MTEASLKRPPIENDPEFRQVLDAVPEAARLSEAASPAEEPKLTSLMAKIAIERAGGIRDERPPEPITPAQQRELDFEQQQREAIKNAISKRLGAEIFQFLALLQQSGRLTDGAETKLTIGNEKLLKLLSEHGYIDAEMADQAQLDLTGLIAGQLLTSKTMPDASKHILVGPYRGLVKELIGDGIGRYFSGDYKSNPFYLFAQKASKL
jgi:hypothetical protein